MTTAETFSSSIDAIADTAKEVGWGKALSVLASAIGIMRRAGHIDNDAATKFLDLAFAMNQWGSWKTPWTEERIASLLTVGGGMG